MNMSQSLRGLFLVAGCRLRDPHFFKSAVLIVEHGAEGAMGMIVNRPTPDTLWKTLNEHLEVPSTQDLIYYGGPVESEALFLVHDCGEMDPDECAIVPGVYMGSSQEVFENVVCPNRPKPAGLKYRVYRGCSSWGPGQLEGELARGDWLLLPAQADYVFHSDPYAVWDELMRHCFRQGRVLPTTCEHPEWN